MKRGVLIIVGSVFLLLMVIVVVILARTQGNQEGTTTLSIWSPFDEAKTYDLISKNFLAKYPNTKLDFKYIDSKDAQDYEAKVVNAIANGNGPDIWLVRSDWIPKHADKSVATTWETVKKATPIDQAKAKLIPSIVDLNTYQGKLYGVPLSADSLAVIYNQDYYTPFYDKATEAQRAILHNMPKTWDELKQQTALSSTIQGTTVQLSGLALGTKSTYVPSDVMTAFLVQSGSKILSDDKKDVTFNIAQYQGEQAIFPATEALTFFTSFATPGQTNYSWSESMGDPIDAFLKGKTGALIGYWSTLQQIAEKKPSFKVIVAPLPQKTESTSGSRVDYAISWSHLVNSKSANQKLAWDYLSFLMENDVQVAYSHATKKIPVNIGSVCNLPDQAVDSSAGKDIFACQLSSAAGLEKPEWQLVDEVFQDMISQVVDLKQTPQNSVDSAAARFKVFQKTD
jgi:multiple sugar transport system substrate-binding protein